MSAALTRILFKSLAAACIIVTVALSASAQKPKASPSPTPPPNQEGTEKIFIRRVRLPITVTDKKGQFVSGLTQNDFVILEDKVPQQIETFRTLPLLGIKATFERTSAAGLHERGQSDP